MGDELRSHIHMGLSKELGIWRLQHIGHHGRKQKRNTQLLSRSTSSFITDSILNIMRIYFEPWHEASGTRLGRTGHDPGDCPGASQSVFRGDRTIVRTSPCAGCAHVMASTHMATMLLIVIGQKFGPFVTWWPVPVSSVFEFFVRPVIVASMS